MKKFLARPDEGHSFNLNSSNMTVKDVKLSKTYRSNNASFLEQQKHQAEKRAEELSKICLPSSDEKLSYLNADLEKNSKLTNHKKSR